MNMLNYWEQFMMSGKVEDYLKFKDADRETQEREENTEKNPKGETTGAGFYERNRNDNQGSAYR